MFPNLKAKLPPPVLPNWDFLHSNIPIWEVQEFHSIHKFFESRVMAVTRRREAFSPRGCSLSRSYNSRGHFGDRGFKGLFDLARIDFRSPSAYDLYLLRLWHFNDNEDPHYTRKINLSSYPPRFLQRFRITSAEDPDATGANFGFYGTILTSGTFGHGEQVAALRRVQRWGYCLWSRARFRDWQVLLSQNERRLLRAVGY